MKSRVRRHLVEQPSDPNIRLIALTLGQNAVVDAADYDFLNQWNWAAMWNRFTKTYYAGRSRQKDEVGAGVTIGMHSMILLPKDGFIPDHESGDTLDNRRKNLRYATATQNAQNRKLRCDSASGFKGVNQYRPGKFGVQIQSHGKSLWLGTRASAEEAHQLYCDAASVLAAEFARFS